MNIYRIVSRKQNLRKALIIQYFAEEEIFLKKMNCPDFLPDSEV